jgi:hypothetical protein
LYYCRLTGTWNNEDPLLKKIVALGLDRGSIQSKKILRSEKFSKKSNNFNLPFLSERSEKLCI